MRDSGLAVSEQPLRVSGRVLNAPLIQYKDQTLRLVRADFPSVPLC